MNKQTKILYEQMIATGEMLLKEATELKTKAGRAGKPAGPRKGRMDQMKKLVIQNRLKSIARRKAKLSLTK